MNRYPSTLKEICIQLEYQINGTYCSENKKYLTQLNAESPCENNFECESNLCINNKYLSGTLWDKILRGFTRLFRGN